MKPSEKEVLSNVALNWFLQLIAVRYSCTKPSSMVKGGVRWFKWSCRLLLMLTANLGPSWCLCITSKRKYTLHTWRVLPFLMGSELREYTKLNAPWAKSPFGILYFSLLGYGTHMAWESYANVKFLSRCIIFWRPYFPLIPFPSALPCCNGNSFHLTSPEGLRDVESASSWKKALYAKGRIIVVTAQGEQICLPKKILQPHLHSMKKRGDVRGSRETWEIQWLKMFPRHKKLKG